VIQFLRALNFAPSTLAVQPNAAAGLHPAVCRHRYGFLPIDISLLGLCLDAKIMDFDTVALSFLFDKC
jgi:hypothetical protein